MADEGGQQAAAGGEATGGEQVAATGGQQAAGVVDPGTPVVSPGDSVDGQIATGSNQAWHENIPDGTFQERDLGILKRFGSVDDLAKGYINAFNLVGRDKIPVPESDSEWEETYNRLGRPKAAEEYTIEAHPDAPDQLRQNMEKNVGWFKQTAHKLGLTQRQAQDFYHEYSGLVTQANKTANDRVESEMTSAQAHLKTELGEAYEGKMALANRAISEIGGEDLIGLFERSGMGRNPTVVKAFIRMGEMMGEEVGLDKTGQSTDSNDSLDAQIAEIQANPAYTDGKAPEHKVLVDKMQKLMSRRHPEEQQAPGTFRLF